MPRRPNPEEVVARFVAEMTASLHDAFDSAFRDGILQAQEELGLEASAEAIMAAASGLRVSQLAYYLPSISKMAGELMTILGRYRSDSTRYRNDPERHAAITLRFRTLFEQQRKRISQRVGLIAGGLTWSAAELGYAAVAEAEGREIEWVLDSGADHCPDCPAYADSGPYSSIAAIGGVPGSSLTACGGKCRCHLEIT